MRRPLAAALIVLAVASCSDGGPEVARSGSDSAGEPAGATVELGGGDEPGVTLKITCGSPATIGVALSGFAPGDVTVKLGDVRTTTVLVGDAGEAALAVTEFDDSNTLTVTDTAGAEVSGDFGDPCS